MTEFQINFIIVSLCLIAIIFSIGAAVIYSDSVMLNKGMIYVPQQQGRWIPVNQAEGFR